MSKRMDPESPEAAIVDDEQKLLTRVATGAANQVTGGKAHLETAQLDKDLIELRDLINEARAEDLPPLIEQMTRLAALRSRLGRSRVLPIDASSPYFAHMVLREGGKRRDVLIGKRGFIDRGAGIQIVDWRNAPISQVYYRYEEGDDFEEEVEARNFTGILEIRRNISIAKSTLRRVGSPQGTFVLAPDGAWHVAHETAPTLQGGSGSAVRSPKPPTSRSQRRDRDTGKGRRRRRGEAVLGVHHGDIQRADKHLPEIAALIDPEQFDLITSSETGLLVIQGGAGSGKTTVALHRIAYLTFANRQKFHPKRVLFVVPTQSLARYVEGVLPALGVSSIPVRTYSGWAKKLRKNLIKSSSNKYNDNTPDSVATVKKHPAMLAILEQFVTDQVDATTAEIAALGKSAVTMKWNQLADEALVPRLRQLYSWVRNANALSDRIRVETLVRRLGKRADDILSNWEDVITDRARILRGFEGSDLAVHAIEQMLRWTSRQCSESLDATDADGSSITGADGRHLDEDSAAGRFDIEDDPILLRLIQLKRGGLMSREVKEVWYQHVAIDEAQDRSALEVKVLLDSVVCDSDDPMERSVTIAGDTAQRLIFDNHFDGWEPLLQHVGAEPGRAAEIVRKLSISYRSTAEVMELAQNVLGPELAPRDTSQVARSGAPVELHPFSDVGEAVAFLGDALRNLMNREPNASVAVVSRYPEQADAYYNGLVRSEVPAIRRVRAHEFTFCAGVDVTDVSRVKGLEFDYVVMVGVDAATYPNSVEARHLLHIGATRAAHQLWIISTGPVSPLLPTRLCEAAGAL